MNNIFPFWWDGRYFMLGENADESMFFDPNLSCVPRAWGSLQKRQLIKSRRRIVYIDKREITLNRGQLVVDVKQLACNWHRSTWEVERILNIFQERRWVRLEPISSQTVITILPGSTYHKTVLKFVADLNWEYLTESMEN